MSPSVLQIFSFGLTILVAAVGTTLDSAEANATLVRLTQENIYEMCMGSAVCRAVYEQDHGEYSPERFARLAAAPLQSLRSASIEQLVVDHLVLRRTLYAESRCPPNYYWRWEADGTATCTCYLDRDCASGDLPICYDAMHPVLIFCILTIILLFSIVYCCTSVTPDTRRKSHPSV